MSAASDKWYEKQYNRYKELTAEIRKLHKTMHNYQPTITISVQARNAIRASLASLEKQKARQVELMERSAEMGYQRAWYGISR